MIRRVFRPRMTGSIQTAGYFVKTNNREMAIINPTRVNGPSSLLARTQITLLENEIGILIILTQNSLSLANAVRRTLVGNNSPSCFPRNFFALTIGMFCEWKNSKCATLSFLPCTHYPRSDCPVGTPPQDEFKWIRKMTLLAGIVASPTMPMPPFYTVPSLLLLFVLHSLNLDSIFIIFCGLLLFIFY